MDLCHTKPVADLQNRDWKLTPLVEVPRGTPVNSKHPSSFDETHRGASVYIHLTRTRCAAKFQDLDCLTGRHSNSFRLLDGTSFIRL